MHLAGLNGAGTAAVAADDGAGLELALGDNLTHSAANAAGLDADDLALLDVIGNGVVGGTEGGRRDGQILQAQLFDGGLHDHVDHKVAVAQVVVEAEGHAALRAALLQGLGEALDELALLGLLIAPGFRGRLLDVLAIHIILSLIDFLAVRKQEIGNLSAYCVFHTRSPSQSPQARASFRVLSAPGINAMSIILPSTVKTPTPAALCSR